MPLFGPQGLPGKAPPLARGEAGLDDVVSTDLSAWDRGRRHEARGDAVRAIGCAAEFGDEGLGLGFVSRGSLPLPAGPTSVRGPIATEKLWWAWP